MWMFVYKCCQHVTCVLNMRTFSLFLLGFITYAYLFNSTFSYAATKLKKAPCEVDEAQELEELFMSFPYGCCDFSHVFQMGANMVGLGGTIMNQCPRSVEVIPRLHRSMNKLQQSLQEAVMQARMYKFILFVGWVFLFTT